MALVLWIVFIINVCDNLGDKFEWYLWHGAARVRVLSGVSTVIIQAGSHFLVKENPETPVSLICASVNLFNMWMQICVQVLKCRNRWQRKVECKRCEEKNEGEGGSQRWAGPEKWLLQLLLHSCFQLLHCTFSAPSITPSISSLCTRVTGLFVADIVLTKCSLEGALSNFSNVTTI